MRYLKTLPVVLPVVIVTVLVALTSQLMAGWVAENTTIGRFLTGPMVRSIFAIPVVGLLVVVWRIVLLKQRALPSWFFSKETLYPALWLWIVMGILIGIPVGGLNGGILNVLGAAIVVGIGCGASGALISGAQGRRFSSTIFGGSLALFVDAVVFNVDTVASLLGALMFAIFFNFLFGGEKRSVPFDSPGSGMLFSGAVAAQIIYISGGNIWWTLIGAIIFLLAGALVGDGAELTRDKLALSRANP